MPDKRCHRGPHPEDEILFSEDRIPDLRSAVKDLSLFLTMGYADKSSLKLVGDHYSLTERQRVTVKRSACSDQQRQSRESRCIQAKDLAGQSLAIDGYNLLITVEAALSGGYLFRGRDRCLRDLASIHGTYRKVEETIPALELIGKHLDGMQVAQTQWFLDSPVSNSGRLKTMIYELAQQSNWPWQAELSLNPDAELSQTDTIVVTSDSIVLDACNKWVNLTEGIINSHVRDAKVIDLCI